MTLAQALAAAGPLGLERLDAQLLLLHVLGRAGTDRAWLLAHDTDPLDATAQAAFLALCARRAEGEPVAYITGSREFFGLVLQVDARVLVPRPDTETLVTWALDLLGTGQWPAPRVLDLGTGSGAIALAVKQHCPRARVEAVDASVDALAVARSNADALGLDVTFRHASWLDGATGPYDLILGNPPYIADGDAHLAALRHEPREALTAGPDGLDAIRAITRQAPAQLATGGWLLLEHGWDQAEAVQRLLSAAGLADGQSRRDLAGIPRVTGARQVELG